MLDELQAESGALKVLSFSFRFPLLLPSAHRNFHAFRREMQAYYRAKIFQKKAALPTFFPKISRAAEICNFL